MVQKHILGASHRRQHVSIKSSFVISLAVVARFSLRRRDLRRLQAVRLVMRLSHRGVVVLPVRVVMGERLLFVGGLQVLALFFLFVLLVLLQPLFTLLDPHELDPALLSTQNHYSKKNNKQRNRQRNTATQKKSLQPFQLCSMVLK